MKDYVATSTIPQNCNSDPGLIVHTFPADEQRISDVERGQSCRAIVPMPPGTPLVAGDSILFALSSSRAGQQPSYVKGGDSVLVCLTDVTDLEKTDPATGLALVELTWEPLGATATVAATTFRRGK
jgi:hypothetical protein